jgi:hypothetical protein
VVLGEPVPARVLVGLHRVLGLGISEVRARVGSGKPVLDATLFGNDGAEVARLVNTVLDLVADLAHTVHECAGGEPPSAANATPAAVMRAILLPRPTPRPVRPVPDPGLTSAIAESTRAAVTDLRTRHPDRFYAFALLTTEDARAPHLSASSVEGDAGTGAERWDLAASPYRAWGHDEHFRLTATADLPVLLASMEEALRALDSAGFFGEHRDDVLLMAATEPPTPADTGSVRRLNPPSAVRAEWLLLCSEQPELAAVHELAPADHAADPVRPPNPSIADLWRVTPGISLPDGVSIYGPLSLGERNATFEAAEYVPGWVVVGDDGGGTGLLMRAPGPDFAAASGRAAAEVFAMGLGALGGDVEDDAEFVTDDLIGWLAARG